MDHKPTAPLPNEAQPEHPSTSVTNNAKDPLLKRLMDNPWILLALGLLIPLISYTLWGWIELGSIPKALLP